MTTATARSNGQRNHATGKTLSRTVYRRSVRAGYRPGWVDALMEPPVIFAASKKPAVIYDASGQRSGTMRRLEDGTTVREMDSDAVA